jgi:hypothetical protein
MAAWSYEPNQANSELGSAVAGAGDVDGDGYDDVLVGASRYDDGSTDEGRVYLFSGGATGLAASPTWTYQPDRATSYVGETLAGAGDLNADGYADVAVGYRSYSSNGRALVFYGASTGLAATADYTEDGATSCWLGQSVAGAGDVDADGYADLLLGAPRCDSYRGPAFLLWGAASGVTSQQAAWSVTDAQYADDLQDGGDLDGDGYGDAIMPGVSGTEARFYVYEGSASGSGPRPPRRSSSIGPAPASTRPRWQGAATWTPTGTTICSSPSTTTGRWPTAPACSPSTTGAARDSSRPPARPRCRRARRPRTSATPSRSPGT